MEGFLKVSGVGTSSSTSKVIKNQSVEFPDAGVTQSRLGYLKASSNDAQKRWHQTRQSARLMNIIVAESQLVIGAVTVPR